MTTREELQTRLINKLKELFQLDQPELDFGFYKIMQAKKDQVEQYLDIDLPKTIQDALNQVSEKKLAALKAAYEEAYQQAKDYGAPDPDNVPAVKETYEAYRALADSVEAEGEIYDHLYRFFDRYYENGDFISRRYRTRETDTKAAPYAIPYNGEEVMLHWANADQYYIKTGEHFSNFSFDLREANEIRRLQKQGELAFSTAADDEPLRVHFKVVDAEEGEHNNVKEADNLQRKFRPYMGNPVELNEAGELVINFVSFFQKRTEYIYDKEMEKRLKSIYGSVGKGDMEPLAAAHIVFDALDSLDDLNPAYKELLKLVPPPARKDTPPLLARYYRKFAAKNTMDYFIHKDLGGFLRRELDFYIKNEVMHLVDLENASGDQFEGFLNKIRALRAVAHDIIDFLAQLEDFQKKLWLKKKFVVETNYCITLDRIPEEFYPQIAANEAQIQEWIHLFAIDEVAPPPYSEEFLKENDKLVVDTRFFEEGFKARLVASIDDFDEQCDGVIISSDNFQGLNLIKSCYHERIEQIFIDPHTIQNLTASKVTFYTKTITLTLRGLA